MNLFNLFKQHVSASKWMSLTAVILLLLSVSLTVRIVQLQQDLRQRAGGPQCKSLHAECEINNSGKSCCSGLTCVPKQHGNGSTCESIPAPTPTTYTPPVYVPPTETQGNSSGEPTPTTSDSGGGIGGTGSTPAPVACGPNGCGWSPRPEGENSTTNAPGVQVCTLSFTGPKQLLGTRLSPTSIRFNWWPTPGGADKQFIMYGLESEKAQWGLVNIAGNQGQIVVDLLPANRTIWAQVRAYRGNCYEDTGWVSVGAKFQAKNAPVIPQNTIVPTAVSTIQPTVIQAALYATPTLSPAPSQDSLFQSINFTDLSLLIFLIILFLFFLLPLFERRRRNKEKSS